MPESFPFTVHNEYSQAVVAYSTAGQPVTNPPSTSATAYYPVYTRLGEVAAGATGHFSTPDPLARIVVSRASDEFPLAVAIVDTHTPVSQTVTVNTGDYNVAEKAWTFYKSYASQPYQPVAVQFSDLVLNTNPTTLSSQLASFFTANGFPGVDLDTFAMVSYWATNSLYAFPGTYQCYQPQTSGSGGFTVPTTVVGTITISKGTAEYTPAPGTAAPPSPTGGTGTKPGGPTGETGTKPGGPTGETGTKPGGPTGETGTKPGGAATKLTFARSALTSAGATPTSGISLTGIVLDLAWQGQPNQIVMVFTGTRDGTQFIAQPWQDPKVPWYAVAYDLVYGAFTVIEIAIALDMALYMLQNVTNGPTSLDDNVAKLIDSIEQLANEIGDAVAPDSSVGQAAETVNANVDVDVDVDVDIDVDTDVDIDVDIDVDVDVDIDVDVDVDIDLDVDVDFVAVVDVDVDVDVDIDVDVDVVTDTDVDVVTDVDVDVDVDVDTEVTVQPGMTSGLLAKIGGWILAKALPELMQNLVVVIAFQSAGQILQPWKQSDTQTIQNLQPRQSTGLGLLLNYMLNEQNPVQTRWNTFADYVQQSAVDNAILQLTVAAVLMTKDAAADTAAANWRWSSAQQQAAVTAMAAFTGANTYRAFQTLGGYTFQNQVLPVKVGAEVAMAYLKATPTAA
jgi:hypothetical protein